MATPKKNNESATSRQINKKNNKDILNQDLAYDSDDASDSWDEDRMDIIGINGNTGDHYIK